jgi:elongation factor P
MIQATQLRRGNTILHNGELFQVVDYTHITPGNWRGMVQTKLRNLRTGSIIDHRFRSEDRVEKAMLDQREMEYLYSDGSDYHGH